MKEIESVNNAFSQSNLQAQWLQQLISPTEGRNTIRVNKCFQRREDKGTLPIDEACITLTPKSAKDIAGRGNYRPISLMNLDVKILSKITENPIQSFIA